MCICINVSICICMYTSFFFSYLKCSQTYKIHMNCQRLPMLSKMTYKYEKEPVKQTYIHAKRPVKEIYTCEK